MLDQFIDCILDKHQEISAKLDNARKLQEEKIQVSEAFKSSRRQIERGILLKWFHSIRKEALIVRYETLVHMLESGRAGTKKKFLHTSFTEWIKSIDAARHDVVHMNGRGEFRRLNLKWFSEELEDFGFALSIAAGFPIL